jgi:hypothetical protein
MIKRADGRLRATEPKTDHVYWVGHVRLTYRPAPPPAKKGKL